MSRRYINPEEYPSVYEQNDKGTRIVNSRLARFLAKLFDVQGALDTVNPTVQPTVSTIPDRNPEVALYRGDFNAYAGIGQSAVAAQFPRIWLINDADRLLTVIRSVIVSSSTAQLIEILVTNSAPPAGLSEQRKGFADKRLGNYTQANPQSRLVADTNVAMPSGNSVALVYVGANVPVLIPMNVVLINGFSLVAYGATVNTTLGVSIDFYERNVDSDEMTP